MWCCKNYIKVWKYWINCVLFYKLDWYSKILIYVIWIERKLNCVLMFGYYMYLCVLLIFFLYGLNIILCWIEVVNGWCFKVILLIVLIMYFNKWMNLIFIISVWCIWMFLYIFFDVKWLWYICFFCCSLKIGEFL